MKISLTRVILSLVLTLLTACKADLENEPELSITGIQPESGTYSSIVTVTGSGFDKNPNSNIVKFNGIQAVVRSATATQLTIEVPKGAGTGKVTIQVNSKTAVGGDFRK